MSGFQHLIWINPLAFSALRRIRSHVKMHSVKRYRLLRIVRWTLAALLFAQGALVANACLRIDTSPQAALSATEMADCDMGTANPNACLYQYLDQSDQNSVQLTPTFPAMPVAALLIARPASVRDVRAVLPPPGCAPPIPIRYCSLLI
jgi:hypothetical protein